MSDPELVIDLDAGEPAPLLIEEEDGGLTVMDPEPALGLDQDHHANLALSLDPKALDAIGHELKEMIEQDKTTQDEWEKIYRDALNELGFDRAEKSRDRPFPGATAVRHPVFAQACIEFQSRAVAQLMLPGGPASARVVGVATPQKQAQADRVSDYLNYQCEEEIGEYEADLDEMLVQLPVAGFCVRKFWYDVGLERIRVESILPEDFILPYGVKKLESAQRATHRYWVNQDTMAERIADGMWVDADVMPGQRDTGDARQKSDRITGESDSGTEQDDEYEIYESHVRLDVPGDEDPRGVRSPYVVTLDATSGKVLGLYRNWRKTDQRREAKRHFVPWNLIPWRGVRGVGFYHLIGGLAGGATGALRALIDSAQWENMPGGLRVKGTRIGGGSINPRPGEWPEVEDGGMGDIRKAVMPFPIKGPSQTLMALLVFLVEAGERFAHGALKVAEDGPKNAPVGTTLALIEEGQKVYTSIFKRLYRAQREELRIIAEINAEWLDDERTIQKFGEEGVILRADFGGPVDILPSADPEQFSALQSMHRAQLVYELSKENEGLIPRRAALERVFAAAKIPNIDEILPPAPEAMPLDPASENMAVIGGKPIAPFPYQDHDAHLMAHLAFLEDPAYGGHPAMKEKVGPALVEHIQQHLAFRYLQQIAEATGHPIDPSRPLPAPIETEVARHVAQVADQIRARNAEMWQGDGEAAQDEGNMLRRLALQVEERRIDADHAIEMRKLALRLVEIAEQKDGAEAEREMKVMLAELKERGSTERLLLELAAKERNARPA